MKHIFNVVSAGIVLGLSLFAIAILTALYASVWQAVSIGLVILWISTSVSLYFGGCRKCDAERAKQTPPYFGKCAKCAAVKAKAWEEARAKEANEQKLT